MNLGADVVRRLQEKAARALPAEHVEQLDGWWLRRTASVAWWAGTVLPHTAVQPDDLSEPDDLVRKVAAAEHFYTRHNAPTRFQISPDASPKSLDALLAQRGYRWDGPLSLQTAETTRVAANAPSGSARVQLESAPTRTWFDL